MKNQNLVLISPIQKKKKYGRSFKFKFVSRFYINNWLILKKNSFFINHISFFNKYIFFLKLLFKKKLFNNNNFFLNNFFLNSTQIKINFYFPLFLIEKQFLFKNLFFKGDDVFWKKDLKFLNKNYNFYLKGFNLILDKKINNFFENDLVEDVFFKKIFLKKSYVFFKLNYVLSNIVLLSNIVKFNNLLSVCILKKIN